MDSEDLNDMKSDKLAKHIPIVGKHLDSWKNVITPDDATIIKLSGLSNITCLVKAKDRSVVPRYVIFRIFNNDLAEGDFEGAVFQCLSDEGIGPK